MRQKNQTGWGRCQPGAGRPIVPPGRSQRRHEHRLVAEPEDPFTATLAGLQGQCPAPLLPGGNSGRRRRHRPVLPAAMRTRGLAACHGRRVVWFLGHAGIGRRVHLVGPCPGQVFLVRITTTVVPALVRVQATAPMVLARKRLTGILDGRQRQWHAHHQGEVAGQRRPHDQVTANPSPKLFEPSPRRHRRNQVR